MKAVIGFVFGIFIGAVFAARHDETHYHYAQQPLQWQTTTWPNTGTIISRSDPVVVPNEWTTTYRDDTQVTFTGGGGGRQ